MRRTKRLWGQGSFWSAQLLVEQFAPSGGSCTAPQVAKQTAQNFKQARCFPGLHYNSSSPDLLQLFPTRCLIRPHLTATLLWLRTGGHFIETALLEVVRCRGRTCMSMLRLKKRQRQISGLRTIAPGISSTCQHLAQGLADSFQPSADEQGRAFFPEAPLHHISVIESHLQLFMSIDVAYNLSKADA